MNSIHLKYTNINSQYLSTFELGGKLEYGVRFPPNELNNGHPSPNCYCIVYIYHVMVVAWTLLGIIYK